MTTTIQILAGFALLILGGEILVRNAVAVATRMKVSPLLIGLTLVGFGTSTPELVTSLEAALQAAPGLAVGNVIGSNVANILLILGLAATVAPIKTNTKGFRRDASFLIVSAILASLAIAYGEIGRLTGAALLGTLGVYLVRTYQMECDTPVAQPSAPQPAAAGRADQTPTGTAHRLPTSVYAALAAAGIALTIFGADLLVTGATTLARSFGVSETVIGLTLVAVGTSLPEMVTSVLAALRKQGDIAVGNIIGSNIYNILGILGVTSLITPIPIPQDIGADDIGMLIAATVALIWLGLGGWRIQRREGGVLLGVYVLYVTLLGAAA